MSQRWSALRDVVGFTGVVVSLLFVGWEVRQNTRVARAQTRVELTALNNEFLDRVGTDPEFAELWPVRGVRTRKSASRRRFVLNS